MIGLKDQTVADVEKTIEVAASAGASHISMYALTPEDGTPVYTDYLNGELPDGDEVAAMYAAGVKKLGSLGFDRYEVSNFCKKGRESRHNQNYWQRGEYIGFGVSASSHINNIRFTNTFDFGRIFQVHSVKPSCRKRQPENRGSRAQGRVLLCSLLRTSRGLNLNEYKTFFEVDFLREFAEKFKRYGNIPRFRTNFSK